MKIRSVIPFIGLSFFVCSSAFDQANGNPTVPRDHAPEKQSKTTLRGCLGGGRGKFYIASFDGDQWYTLTGNTSALAKYMNKEISVEGEEDVSTQPLPPDIGQVGRHSFEVVRVKVFDTPKPSLSPSFSNSSTWHTETNPTYGIKFAHPVGVTPIPASKSIPLQANFVTDQKLVTVARFEIPREVYPSTNFVGGFFSIFLNPEITNSPSCGQFGTVDRRFRSSYTVGKTHYASAREVSGAAGSREVNYYFHVFQNGGCYELAFEFVEYDPSNADLGCRIPLLEQEDDLNLAKPFIAQVSFFRPTLRAPRRSNPQAVPRVTDFVASSQTADDVTNRGQITFSWSTQNADYVEFSYRCVPAPNAPGVVILEPGGSRECENANPRLYPPENPNRSPHASQTVSFGNYHQLDPISIIVAIMPFSQARAYPHASKSITVRVNPHNPFPEGVPAANGNIIITYSTSPDGKGNYQQGSSLTIRWTDALSRDPCVNLYLVQDDGSGGASYRLQIGDTCFTPSSSGSYTWTIPHKYLGFGYRIFAMAPGVTSTGVGPAFSIIRPRLH